MIGQVLKRGSRAYGLLWYLYGPGRACEHTDPHLVSGWRHPAELEPPLRPDGRRDLRLLAGLLEQPVAAAGELAPDKYVWHCAVRAKPGDPDLGDGAWMNIAAEIMHRTGLSRRGEEEYGCRWVAVHHGQNHIHIVATLARQDGRRARTDNDYYRIGEACADIEREYGLQVVARGDRTAARNPTRAEKEKAVRAGRAEAPRVTLQRHAAAAAAAARSEPEFFAGLEQRGVLVRRRYSVINPGEVTGYAVGLPGDLTGTGGQLWYGGGKLAPDLTLPKLRRRWPGPGSAGPDGPARLDGRGMRPGPARAVLRRETALAAAAARSEPEFFAALQAAGLLVRIRPSTTRPGQAAGYAVSLPGLVHHRDGHQVWYGGQTLDGPLALGVLRRRWRARLAGAAPAAAFTGAEADHLARYAADVAAQAARAMRAVPGTPQAEDMAWAAADLLYAAADAVGDPALRRAADAFARAARAPWGRIPAPSPGGSALRTAAYLMAKPVPGGTRRRMIRLGLADALAGLAGAVADMRAAQSRLGQASAARRAAAGLAGIAPAAARAGLAAAETAGPPLTVRPATARPAGRPGPGRRPRPRPGPRAGPGRGR